MFFRWVPLDCDRCTTVLDPRVSTVRELRAVARAEGWVLTSVCMYCPSCVAARAEYEKALPVLPPQGDR